VGFPFPAEAVESHDSFNNITTRNVADSVAIADTKG
jgi:hypothetical protein